MKATRKKIVYRDLWPGIDLVYSGTFDRLKYEFVVRRGPFRAAFDWPIEGPRA